MLSLTVAWCSRESVGLGPGTPSFNPHFVPRLTEGLRSHPNLSHGLVVRIKQDRIIGGKVGQICDK